jgi:hypothetical protein
LCDLGGSDPCPAVVFETPDTPTREGLGELVRSDPACNYLLFFNLASGMRCPKASRLEDTAWYPSVGFGAR